MSRLAIIIAAAVIAVLIVSDVIEIKLNPERLAQVTTAMNQSASSKGVLAEVRSFGVRLKRKGELFLADNANRKMVLSLGYVETDTERLNSIIDTEETPKAIVPQAELLVDSLQQVKDFTAAASADALAEVTDRSREVLAAASTSLERLKQLQEEYQWYQERLADVTSNLEGEVNALSSEPAGVGDVAGSQDEQKSDGNPNETRPLKF